jgi:molybdopterin-guanine dinucleotide biosynthesis protein A
VKLLNDFGLAVILCGGKSSRMGFDKSNIKLNNKFLIEIIADELSNIFENVMLISNDVDKFKDTKYIVVEDIIVNSGPMVAIYTALKQATSKYVFVTACDMPIINLDFIKYMMDIIKNENVQGVVSYNDQYIEPLYAFYSIDMINKFEMELNKKSYKLHDVIKNSNIYFIEETKWRECCGNVNIFTNLNYKCDLTALKNIFLEDS